MTTRWRRLVAEGKAAETLFAVFLVLFAAVYLWQSLLLPPARNAPVGPGSFPILIGVLMLVLAGWLLYLELRAAGRGTDAATAEVVPIEDDDTSISDWPGVAVVVGALLVMIVLFERLGFVVSLSLFVFGLATFFSPRRWLVNLIVALVISVAFYLLFTRILSIRLPGGVLGSLF